MAVFEHGWLRNKLELVRRLGLKHGLVFVFGVAWLWFFFQSFAFLAVLLVLGLGAWISFQASETSDFEPDAVYLLRDALVRLSQAGGGRYEFRGLLLLKDSYFDARSFALSSSNVLSRDYRYSEFNPRFLPVSADALAFSCSFSDVECGRDVVALRTVRVDAEVSCRPVNESLACSVDLSESEADRAVLPVSAVPGDAAEADAADFVEVEASRMQSLSRPSWGPLDAYSGQLAEQNSEFILSIAEINVVSNVASETRFELEANRKYGIPFFDGTKTPEAHLAFLSARVHEPRPLPVSEPKLAELEPSAGWPFAPSGVLAFRELQPRRSLSGVVLDALFFPSIKPIYRLKAFATDVQTSLGGIFWQRRNQGSLDDRIRRLEALYLIQTGFDLAQYQQRIANAVLWLEAHPGLNSVFVQQDAIAGAVFDSSVVSQDAGGVSVRFQQPAFDGLESRLQVESGRVRVKAADGPAASEGGVGGVSMDLSEQGRIRFYWIVQKDALNKSYFVMPSRTRYASGEP